MYWHLKKGEQVLLVILGKHFDQYKAPWTDDNFDFLVYSLGKSDSLYPLQGWVVDVTDCLHIVIGKWHEAL